MRTLSGLRARAGAFFKTNAGNVAITMALAALPLTLAMGAGVDYARGLAVHSSLTDALDAAGLAVGAATTKPSSNCSSDGSSSATTGNGPAGSPTSCSTIQQLAQQYFNANFNKDSSADTVGNVSISYNSTSESVTLSVNDSVPTTFLAAADKMMGTTKMDSMGVSASSTVVWGQTKLWVALVLDNSGSMSDSDKNGSKMDALQAASQTLLTTLQGASATAGDVQVAIVPFTREAKVGTGNAAASWLYWGFWEAPGQANGVTITTTTPIANPNFSSPATIAFAAWGPGDPCPFTNDTTSRRGTVTINTESPFGYYCTSGSANGSSNIDTIPSSGGTKGYICPSEDSGAYNPDRHDHYYNGCWTSVKDTVSPPIQVSKGSSADCTGFTNSCTCSGTGSSKACTVQPWIHTWVVNNHSTWTGCITDRMQDYDIQDTTPVSTNTTGVPADNASDNNCMAASITPLSYNWTGTGSLSAQITAMSPGGTTNQAIGVANGWLALTTGDPYGAPTLPANTSRYIILLSDGLNTEDRWYGDGSTTGSTDDAKIDARENSACTAAKTDGVVIYTLFLDLGGTQGNSTPLQNCATDSSKYIDLTSTSQVAAAFANIGQQITSLRVSN
jgi:Flp pilus assembly protein TadG